MFALAFSPLATSDFTRVIPELGPDAKFSTGLHKLVSQVVFMLLTDQGSVSGSPLLGLTLRESLGRIALTQTPEIERLLSDATADILSQLRPLQVDLPPSEQLKSLSLTAIRVVDPYELVIELSVESVAGESATYSSGLLTRSMA